MFGSYDLGWFFVSKKVSVVLDGLFNGFRQSFDNLGYCLGIVFCFE